jgi:hypothetical protein
MAVGVAVVTLAVALAGDRLESSTAASRAAAPGLEEAGDDVGLGGVVDEDAPSGDPEGDYGMEVWDDLGPLPTDPGGVVPDEPVAIVPDDGWFPVSDDSVTFTDPAIEDPDDRSTPDPDIPEWSPPPREPDPATTPSPSPTTTPSATQAPPADASSSAGPSPAAVPQPSPTPAGPTASPDVTPPSSPGNPRVVLEEVGPTVVRTRVYWDPSTDAESGLSAYRLTYGASSWGTLQTTMARNVPRGTTAEFSIVAIDRAGNVSVPAIVRYTAPR